MPKPIKYVVAIVLKKPESDEFLVVQRPKDDPDLAGAWGLPAVTMQPGELPEAAALRVCQEKLNCSAVPVRFMGLMFQKRNSYDLFLMDIEMELLTESLPNIRQAKTTHTAYINQKWTTDPMELMPSAKHGSCCSSIFLTDRGILDREEWINSLEGSNLVA